MFVRLFLTPSALPLILMGYRLSHKQTNTTIKFQVATVAKSPADAALASWIANGNFLVVLAMGPIFVRNTSLVCSHMLIHPGFSWRSPWEEVVSRRRCFAWYCWFSHFRLCRQDYPHHRWQYLDWNRKCRLWKCPILMILNAAHTYNARLCLSPAFKRSCLTNCVHGPWRL